MRPTKLIAGLTAALAVAAAPAAAQAACQKRTTGTVVGAVTGGLLGNVVAGRGDRTEGTLIGAAAGGLVGNQVSKCKRTYRSSSRSYQRASNDAPRYATSCRYETRTYYDQYGRAVHQPTRVCGR